MRSKPKFKVSQRKKLGWTVKKKHQIIEPHVTKNRRRILENIKLGWLKKNIK